MCAGVNGLEEGRAKVSSQWQKNWHINRENNGKTAALHESEARFS